MDIAILINKYLKDKADLRDPENDYVNIVDNQIHTWSFANIPCPTAEELAACEVAVLAKQAREAKLAQIEELEVQVTPRRLREALISGDRSFIESIDAQIAAIRATL